jgi:hypothetical protein
MNRKQTRVFADITSLSEFVRGIQEQLSQAPNLFSFFGFEMMCNIQVGNLRKAEKNKFKNIHVVADNEK